MFSSHCTGGGLRLGSLVKGRGCPNGIEDILSAVRIHAVATLNGGILIAFRPHREVNHGIRCKIRAGPLQRLCIEDVTLFPNGLGWGMSF